MSTYHVPVMLKECLDALNIQPNGIYVDVTFGGGGHTRAILEKLDGGMLYAFDQDADAKANAEEFQQHRSFTFVESNFRFLKRQLRFHGVKQVDGILADLGVSSHQLDEGSRGFSTRFDGELDMRMDQGAAVTAKHVVNEYDQKDLIHILSAYGEVKNAKTLAAAIIRARGMKTIHRNEQLREIALTCAPRGKEMKYLAQLFQAIRIEVNDEMGALHEFLEQTPEVIKPGGRLVVMSYHSLEDRPVKNFINAGNIRGKQEKDFYGNIIRPFESVTRKPIIAGEEELERNNRARSAKLRIAERNSN
ncbi:MAG: 16S rRNA (cytosine(1402)-N(4))-methyltransferase [Flammeovirgaceae bacterium]|nr:16S rRNA (cytosine(1402)-N(4))-methyltransferase [Flammeovirgaceae bacterium]MBE62764.1 16S rRNA (cytosine(1402)-N(4))-methyltransferase [Flammeovirgaceae bacterium]HCX20764.1 16S rRNA (cytosine(1402)-N(4))-methyltransferase [Cytophagales bacterium]|tara:strand:- start:2082 stop:2996 length:915 start_codon:yes stop_codon:yes gene_type:complete